MAVKIQNFELKKIFNVFAVTAAFPESYVDELFQ